MFASSKLDEVTANCGFTRIVIYLSLNIFKLCFFVFQKLRIDMRISLPRVESRGSYEVNGNVLLLPVRSNGDFWAEFCKLFLQTKN